MGNADKKCHFSVAIALCDIEMHSSAIHMNTRLKDNAENLARGSFVEH